MSTSVVYIFQNIKVFRSNTQELPNNSNNAVCEGNAAVHCSWAWVLAVHACPVKGVKNVSHDRAVYLVNILMFKTRKVLKKINNFFFLYAHRYNRGVNQGRPP